uniref:Calponin-homology (CH) domain-containing protein n=2 Tax=Parascaris univalens TaxID=6257 RepID=A0A915A6Z3_PARUN
MFEEAELSGVLMLASRKLKEFPSNLAVKYDISDVISADLSDNRMNELPVCICELSSMETLRVRATGLRSLPAAVQLLESLTYLDLSENQLTSLPVGLFSIHLQVLLLAGNRLDSLPREIRQLAGSLHELDVSCNRLQAIPPDIALLKLLRVLNLRDNRLTHLPSELSRMELRVLDVSENELGELPYDLRHMCSLIELRLHGNPLTTPPATICSKGREHVFKWLRAQMNASEGGSRPLDWSMNRPVTINATLRRGRYNDNGIDTVARRVERRSRSTRFNTLGGSDSGYASTADEHRYSHEYQTSTAAGCLFGINESLRSPPAAHESPPYIDYTNKPKCCEVVQSTCIATTSSSSGYTGGLLNEVMSAYAKKMGTESPLSRTIPTSTSQRTTIERALLYSNSSILSSSSSSACSSTAVSHRPQAIVSPMTAVNSPATDRVMSVKSTVTKETLIEGNEFRKTGTDTSAMSSSTTTIQISSRNIDKAMDLSNNNTVPKRVTGACDNDKQIDAQNCGVPLSTTLNVRICDSPTLAFSSAEIETIYTTNKQRMQTGGGVQERDQPKLLSPVIEAPAAPAPVTSTMNGNATINSSASIAVRSSIVPESACSAVCPVNTTASVSSAIKEPTGHPTRTLGRNSRSSSSLNSSRSSVASSRAIPALKRPLPAPHASTTNTNTTSMSRTTNKLTKTRDSLGLARSQMNGKTSRKPTSAVSEKPRPLQMNDANSVSTTRTVVASTVTHTSSGIIDNMRKALEQRLNLTLPHERDQLAASLADGIHLCNFVNSIRARAVPTVLIAPSPNAQLSTPKCRRNVENFLSACRRMGVPELSLSLCSDILERRNLQQTARTTLALNRIANATNNATVRLSESRRITNV